MICGHHLKMCRHALNSCWFLHCLQLLKQREGRLFGSVGQFFISNTTSMGQLLQVGGTTHVEWPEVIMTQEWVDRECSGWTTSKLDSSGTVELTTPKSPTLSPAFCKNWLPHQTSPNGMTPPDRQMGVIFTKMVSHDKLEYLVGQWTKGSAAWGTAWTVNSPEAGLLSQTLWF